MTECWCANCGKKGISAGLAADRLLILTAEGVGIVPTGVVVCLRCAAYSDIWRTLCQN